MKRPENMTPEERFARIRSLERQLAIVANERDWARSDEASTRRWAEEAWKEVRRLHQVIEHQQWQHDRILEVVGG